MAMGGYFLYYFVKTGLADTLEQIEKLHLTVYDFWEKTQRVLCMATWQPTLHQK